MSDGVSMQTVPTYFLSAFRHFLPNERHISRIEGSDVLLLMLDGVLRFTENGIPVELSRGEYYIQQRGLPQSGPAASDCPSYFYLHFRECTWSDQGPFLPRRGSFDPDALLPLLQELNDAENEDAPLIIKNGLLCTILTRLFREQARSDRDMLADHMVRCLTQDLQNPPTLSELAAEFHFSENYLIRIFRDAMGTTPHAYLNAARIRKAKLLLSTSNMTADRIAYTCGFADYAHFYRIFRKETGCTPKDYRRKMLSKKG